MCSQIPRPACDASCVNCGPHASGFPSRRFCVNLVCALQPDSQTCDASYVNLRPACASRFSDGRTLCELRAPRVWLPGRRSLCEPQICSVWILLADASCVYLIHYPHRGGAGKTLAPPSCTRRVNLSVLRSGVLFFTKEIMI